MHRLRTGRRWLRLLCALQRPIKRDSPVVACPCHNRPLEIPRKILRRPVRVSHPSPSPTEDEAAVLGALCLASRCRHWPIRVDTLALARWSHHVPNIGPGMRSLPLSGARSGRVRYVTRPESEATRATRQLRPPPRHRRAWAYPATPE